MEKNRRPTSDRRPQQNLRHRGLRSDVRGLRSALSRRLHLLRRFEHFLNRSPHIESLLGNVVILAFDNGLETFHRFGHLYIASRRTCKLLGHKEWLGEETLNVPGPRYGNLLIFAEFVDTENHDKVLQILVGLQK